MSFTTLLSNLQTLISSRFLIASFFPAIAFWFGNAIMMFLFNAPFQEYVANNIDQSTGMTALIVSAALIFVAFTAYAEYALLPKIQSFMEGNWSEWLVALFAPSQMNYYERLDRDMKENLRLRGSIGTAAGGVTRIQAWKNSVATARAVGTGRAGNNYTLRNRSARLVARLARVRARAKPIYADAITSVVAALTPDLRGNNADLPGPDNDFALEMTRNLMWDLIDYAEQYALAQYRSLITRRQFEFGPVPHAPTSMGNVAKTVMGYAVDRYNFNFELLWSRLQLAAQKDKDFGPVLQTAKTQLDFLVSCSALTFFWAFFWTTWLFITAGPPWVFVGVALVGPAAAYGWYWVAVAQYRSLADLLRSSIDLFRFDLLTALHYPIPDGVLEERDLWERIDELHLLHEMKDLRYSRSRS